LGLSQGACSTEGQRGSRDSDAKDATHIGASQDQDKDGVLPRGNARPADKVSAGKAILKKRNRIAACVGAGWGGEAAVASTQLASGDSQHRGPHSLKEWRRDNPGDEGKSCHNEP
jgi:hypothetical protein